VADLEQIADYIARDNPNRAAGFVEELEAKCRAAAATPDLFPPRFELVSGLRMAEDGTVRVERVLHSARNVQALLRR
jgi:toxin ParE1/3/4